MTDHRNALKDLRARLPILEKRAGFLREIRAYFTSEGFLEADAPLLVPAGGMEPHLDPFEAKGWNSGVRYLLPTSPEFYLKKLLAAGAKRCFSLAPSFRDEPPGRGHSPEFLMLEWYRTHARLRELLADCGTLLKRLGTALRAPAVPLPDGGSCRLSAGIEVFELSEAFEQWAGVSWRVLDDVHAWREAARRWGGDVNETWTENDCFSYLLLTRIEPALARLDRPAALFGYPSFQGALAREREDDPGVIDRFELYAAGVELANAYQELTDGEEQRRRYAAYQEERLKQGKPPHPPDEEFFEAVDLLPECAGTALGADRLFALLTGRTVLEVRHGTNGRWAAGEEVKS